MDRRFVAATREAFEKATGLGPADYWHESYAGGAALAPATAIGEEYALAHGASIFGWQAHLNGCGGQPGVGDQEIGRRLDRTLAAMKGKFPHARHFRAIPIWWSISRSCIPSKYESRTSPTFIRFEI